MDNSVDLIDWLGEDLSLALGGLVIGALFGFFAQRSRFCLRAAVVEVARAQAGAKLSVWLLAFSSALILTQTMILLGAFDTANVRQLSSPGSVSGSLIGGLLFGIGMVLARGCSSRLLVLAANGPSARATARHRRRFIMVCLLVRCVISRSSHACTRSVVWCAAARAST